MKRMGKIIIAGLCLGLPLLFVKIVFQIPDDLFWKYYLICGGIAVVGTAAFNLLYNRRYLKKRQPYICWNPTAQRNTSQK